MTSSWQARPGIYFRKQTVRRLRILFASVLLLCVFTSSGLAHAQETEPPLQVATALCPPFVIKEGQSYSGLSIYLWDQIARRAQRDYDITEYGLKEMMQAVVDGNADVAVTCLTITHDREKLLDFSHSFFETNLAIAVKQRGYFNAVSNFFLSRKILIVLGIVAAVAALIGGIFYFLEHRVNPKLYTMRGPLGKPLEAFIVGLLFITRGPIRYYEFQTGTARILSAFLGVGSTVIIASITALLASAFTLELLRSEISGVEDLSKVRVGAHDGSTSAQYLEDNGINFYVYSNKQELLNALNEGTVDAVVSDSAVLKYLIKEGTAAGQYDSLSLLPFEFEKQNYGLAIPDDSPYVELLDQAVLSVRDTPEWSTEITRYLGE